MQALDVDDVIAHLLVAEGFTRLEEIAYVPTEETRRHRGLRRDHRRRAAGPGAHLAGGAEPPEVERYRELGVSDDLAAHRA